MKIFWNQYAQQESEIFMNLTDPFAIMAMLKSNYIAKSVGIMNRPWVPILTSSSCLALQAYSATYSTQLHLLSKTLFPEEVYQLGLVKNTRLRTTNYAKYMKKKTTHFFESGETTVIRRQLAMGFDFGPFSYDKFRACMIDSYTDFEVNAATTLIENVKNVMLCHSICSVFSFHFLRSELRR